MSRFFSHIVVTLALLLTTSVYAQELIHFDCLNGDTSGRPDTPTMDVMNDPPNDLQCLPTGAAVDGPGTVHPNLEIKSPHGRKLLKLKASDDAFTAFISHDSRNQNNNCLEFLDQGRQFVTDQFGGAWGFGDSGSCVGEACEGATQTKVELDFIFHRITVSDFSLRMVDWGDFRPKATNPDDFQVTLTAYDDSGDVVDTYNYHFTVETYDPEPVYIAHECVSEVGNSCIRDGTNLLREGDACNAKLEDPGYLTLAVSGSRIARVELRIPSHGYDPNVGFDTIRFTPE